MSSTVVSAPGKVLAAGGYLVLDPAYSGVVISTSSRFYTIVRENPFASAATIRVRSPQFVSATWLYNVTFSSTVEIEPAEENTSANKFVHLALQSTLVLAVQIIGLDALESLNLPRSIASLAAIPPFSPTGVSLSEVHKTGLGSSAALITSLTSALLAHLSVIPKSSLSDDSVTPTIDDGRRLAHNLAQYVHCRAQGKVGSGFDVSAAVFGSHIYTRFDPSVIQDLMAEPSPSDLLSTISTTNSAWNYRINPFKLPPYTRLMLADVDAGSDTPSLVGKVLKWRQDKAEDAKALWTHLNELNQSMAAILLELSNLHDQDPENYASAVKYISSLQSIQWVANPWQPPAEQPIVTAFYKAHKVTQSVRSKMKEMGSRSGVPIEPDEQTRLLDACISQAGVIGGGVPGAGGYDAIWLLVCDPVSCHPDQSPVERIEHVWRNYEELSVSPLSSKESAAKGLRLEAIEEIPGLQAALEE